MLAILAVLLIVVPFVELIVVLKVAGEIGLFPTVLLLVGISVAGGALLKHQGISTWRKLRAALDRGEIPAEEISDGAMILFGGALLLTPGFVTDAVGLLLLVPPGRRLAKRSFRRLFEILAFARGGPSVKAAVVGHRAHEARVTKVRRTSSGGGTEDASPRPESRPPLPSEPRRAGEDGSPGRR